MNNSTTIKGKNPFLQTCVWLHLYKSTFFCRLALDTQNSKPKCHELWCFNSACVLARWRGGAFTEIEVQRLRDSSKFFTLRSNRCRSSPEYFFYTMLQFFFLRGKGVTTASRQMSYGWWSAHLTSGWNHTVMHYFIWSLSCYLVYPRTVWGTRYWNVEFSSTCTCINNEKGLTRLTPFSTVPCRQLIWNLFVSRIPNELWK